MEFTLKKNKARLSLVDNLICRSDILYTTSKEQLHLTAFTFTWDKNYSLVL